MNIYTVCGFALLSCAASVILRRFENSAGVLIPAAALVSFAGAALAAASPIGDFIDSLNENGRFTDYFSIMMKSLGTAMLGECACDICRDCGEQSIANGVELCTKISLLILALPLITKLTGLAADLLAK
ncbi:MAG: stage III sporulation AC/AD family protein [Clostridia bacterium]|nr:stage III sporulation AC/AD family protein [Clostridia bacterium]